MTIQAGAELGHTQIRFRLRRIGPFCIESHHAKFRDNPLKNGWQVFKGSAGLHGKLGWGRVWQ